MRCLGGCLLFLILSGLLYASVVLMVLTGLRRGW